MAEKSSAARTIAIAGLVAGVLDIGYVLVFYGLRGASGVKLLQGIAAAVLGRDAAAKGGLATAALGLAMHFAIALGCAAIFYALSRKRRFLIAQPWVFGSLYGVAVWLVMQLVVLPLTATPPKAFPPSQGWPVFIAHLLCVGLPIALIVRWRERRLSA